jgi:hypothetical protein
VNRAAGAVVDDGLNAAQLVDAPGGDDGLPDPGNGGKNRMRGKGGGRRRERPGGLAEPVSLHDGLGRPVIEVAPDGDEAIAHERHAVHPRGDV